MADGKPTYSPSPERRLLFELMTREKESPAARTIEKRESDDPPPLSFAQERQWFLEQLDPGSPAYNVPVAVRLRGPLKPSVLEQSINEIVIRHESLRTTFDVVSEAIAQIIASGATTPLPIIDMTALPKHEKLSHALEIAAREANRPFDLILGPLFRVRLIRLAQNEHILLTIHRIVADGWSMGVFFRELASIYEAMNNTRPSPLPVLPIQYADFAHWQRRWLSGGILESHLSFWRENLAGATPTEIAADRPRPQRPTHKGARHHLIMSCEMSDGLRRLSTHEGVTLFMLLLTAFNVLLHRYTGNGPVVVGTPIAGRARQELEGLIGLFVNTLVIRTDVSGNPSFRELLQRTRRVCTDAYAHQDLPFEKLVQELRPARGLSRNPLFQILFLFQNTPKWVESFAGLALERLETDNGTSKFDLTLSLEDKGSELGGFIEYSTDLFDARTIARMADHLQVLLRAIMSDPGSKIGMLPLLSEQEQFRMLHEWSGTADDYPQACIHELFEEQSERTPDACALVLGEVQLTFRELNSRANQFARHLRSLSIGPEAVVGLYTGRSIEAVVGILGILKSGGAYLPLDPNYPEERLAFMIRDSRTAALVSHGAGFGIRDSGLEEDGEIPNIKSKVRNFLARPSLPVSGLPFSDVRQVVYMDRDWDLISKNSPENLSHSTCSNNLAYLMYTSGSTGTPKAVLGLHGGTVNRLHWMWRNYTFEIDEICCQKTSLSFVDSVWELFGPLLQGTKTSILPGDVLIDPALTIETLEKYEVTRIVLVPSLLRLLLQHEGGLTGRLPSLRTWTSSGETLPALLARSLLEALPQSHLLNLYGSSEAAADVTCYEVEAADRRAWPDTPVGLPIANTALYLLDRYRMPTPRGIPGEIHVGGVGLARGYLNHPDWTAEQFVPAFSIELCGRRVYRTGDLGRHLPDGNLLLQGRADHQVKIRGYRIEPGEIEATLRRHTSIREAMVIPHVDGTDVANLVHSSTNHPEAMTQFVAYLVTRESGPAPNASELNRFLADHLPEYMIPTDFMVVEALPLTPSGKLDRRSIPFESATRIPSARVFLSPRTPTEEMLRNIWSEVLGKAEISINDNFFDLGGHSLLITRVTARIRVCFGVEMPVRAMFEAPTVEALSTEIDTEIRSGQRTTMPPPLVRLGMSAHHPLSFSQQRLWFLNQLDPGIPGYNISPTFRLAGPCDIMALNRSFEDLAARHDALRTTFQTHDEEPRAIVHEHAENSLTLIDLRGLPTHQKDHATTHLTEELGNMRFDLTLGPLVRVTLARTGDESYVLILALHHIIADGWSVRLLLRELSELYQAHTNGTPHTLPPLSIRYTDFAGWQRAHLQGKVLAAHIEYWRNQLKAPLSTLSIPTDRSRPAVQTFRGARCSIALSKALSDGLKRLSRRAGATLFMTLLAAFKVVLARSSGQTDIVIGTTIAGRNLVETENLVGFFINALVLRTDISGNPTFLELMTRVRETCLGAYAHQELPFDRIVDEIKPERDLNRNPIFQILFNMVNVSDIELNLPGLELLGVSHYEASAKFDLILYAPERERGIDLILSYNTELFTEKRINAFLGTLEFLLTQIAQKPETRIEEFSLLPPSARSSLPDPTVKLNDSWKGSVTELISHQTRRNPNKAAIVERSGSWTYEELETRSNRIANTLLTCGIAPGDPVAIYAERNGSFICAILGILKAGAAFLILDPAFPAARLMKFLRIAKPKGWLQTAESPPIGAELERYLSSESLAVRMVLSGRWDEQLTGEPSATNNVPSVTVGPNDLAYIAFTSGSTGVPKAVLGRHGPVSHFLPFLESAFELHERHRFSLLAGLSFNTLHREVFTPLYLGATICIPYSAELLNPGWLPRWLQEQQITIAHLTPAMGQVLQHAREPINLPLLACAFFAGDVLKNSDIIQLRALAPNARIVNFYGATETQRAVGYFIVPEDPDLSSKDKPSPLGKGIEDVQLLVMSPNQQLAGVGELGEIHVRSPHLAEGYLNDPELTAARFIINPFTGLTKDRLFKTGELGRYSPDGNVEFAGRLDRRTNIRGFRVEPEEIEAQLRQHPAVLEAFVTAHELRTSSGDPTLVAYLTTRGNLSDISSELRNFLRPRLPDYMIPGHFVFLEAFPLTPNGKVDEAELPAPDSEDPAFSEKDQPPVTTLERDIAAVWAQILGHRQIDVHANFFELGGHSLLAIQTAARLQETYGIELPLRDLFELPTVARLARRIDELRMKPEEREEAFKSSEHATRGPVRASSAQERFWFLQQLNPGSGAYNIYRVERIFGSLDLAALDVALAHVTARHSVLRWTFRVADGHPVPHITPVSGQPTPLVDLRHLEEARKDTITRALIGDVIGRPFDLEEGPLFRPLFLRLANERHILILVMHHVVCDGWSLQILSRELSTLYQAFVTEAGPQLAPLPVQYSDFAAWQHTDTRLQSNLRYWRQQLSGCLPRLELPRRGPRPSALSFRGARQSLSLPKTLTDKLKSLSRQEGTTLFMTMLAAFNTLLYRYTGQEDLMVGSPIAGRNRSQFEGLIGLFVNTLVLRTELSGKPSFRELLGRVHQVCLDAYDHQDCPFEKIVEAMQPERDTSRNPLFQVMFVFRDVPATALELRELTVERVPVHSATSQFDLTVSMVDRPQGLIGTIEFSTDLMNASTAKRMAGHFEKLLESIVEDPQESIATLEILTAQEKHQLLVEWNDTTREHTQDNLIYELFEVQARLKPDVIALVSGDRALSYRELNARANQLAHHLRTMGVQPETRVGILVDRSIEMVIALLGTLKAGSAYVPLDPTYPTERIDYMIRDSRIKVMVTRDSELGIWGSAVNGGREIPTSKSEGFPPNTQHPTPNTVVLLDLDQPLIQQQPNDNLSNILFPANLAYVIYTSGSTGNPKGIQVTHSALSNLLASMAVEPGIDEADVWLAVTTISFDIAALELYLPLVMGGRVVLASRDQVTDGQKLVRQMVESEATIMQATPSGWSLLVESGWSGDPHLKALCGGEALPHDLANALLERTADLWNLFGPTETTIWSSAQAVTADPLSVPIGQPIANTRMRILDGEHGLVPILVAGELYIGGDGVARGYLTAPEATAERFVPDPCPYGVGSRLYRTGDRARTLEDGSIDFLGRVDFQMKVRGHRVEPGEIEFTLRQHPNVRQAVLVSTAQTHDDAQSEIHNSKSALVAFIETSGDQPSEAELRHFLEIRLPAHMLPTRIVFLDKIPLTANGKVDRATLSSSALPPLALYGPFAPPRTPTEELLVGIWADTLGLEAVSIHDNFFELGGHSLLAITVLSRVREVLDREVMLQALFDKPTVAGLAAVIEGALRTPEAQLIPPMTSVSRNEPLPLSITQEQLWRIEHVIGSTAFFNMPYAYSIEGSLNARVLMDALNATVERHEGLRTVVTVTNDQPAQVILPHLKVTVPLIDLIGLPEAKRQTEKTRLAKEEARLPLDAGAAPLFRAWLLQLTANGHILLLTMHHLIADDWSMRCLRAELFHIYDAFHRNEEPSLPALPFHLVDFAHWQRSLATTDFMRKQLDYWRGQLSTPLESIRWPGAPYETTLSFETGRYPLEFDPEVFGAIETLARKEGSTPFMIVMTALAAVIHRWLGQRDIRIATLMANRARPGADRLFGHLINTVVIRTRVLPELTFAQLSRQVRERVLEAHNNQDLPFEVLAQTLKLEQGTHPASLVKILFIYHNFDNESLALSENCLHISNALLPRGDSELTLTAFDLIFRLRETRETLTAALSYKTELFDWNTAAQLVVDLEATLYEGHQHPDAILT